MAGNLHFDVTARDSASSEFAAIARQLAALSKQLRDLDGKKAKADVALNGAAQVQAQAKAIRIDVDSLDGRRARVSISLDSASTAPITVLSGQLDRIDGRTAKAHVTVDVDKDVPGRLAGVTDGISRLASSATSAAPALGVLRTATQGLIDPGSLPIVERMSAAISGQFHAAVDKARGVVDKLAVANRALGGSLVGLGAIGNTVQVIGGLTAAVTQLSGAMILLPGVLAGAGAAISTLKVGFASFWDAVNADTAKKYTKATEDMSKAALSAVVAVRQLTNALKGTGDIGGPVQTAMFRGISDQIYALNTTYIPVLAKGMTGIATGFNAMGREALLAVGKAKTVSQVSAIFASTSTAVGNMRLSLANAVTGFATLGKAGSTYLPRLGTAIDQAAGKFSVWADRITSDGTFDRWAENGITAFRQLGEILGNIGSIVGSVFSAMSASGGGALASFAKLTGTVKDFLNSVQGSSALASFASVVTAAGNALSQVLGAAMRAVAPLITALGPALSDLAVSLGNRLTAAIQAVTPLLTRFAQALSENPAVLTAVAQAIGIAALAFGPLVAVLGVAATLLKGLLLARLVGAAMGALGMEGTLLARVLTSMTGPLAFLRTWLPEIAAGAGRLAAGFLLATGPVGALIVLFATLYASSSQFRAGMDQIAATIGQLFVRALTDAGAIINSTVALIGDIGSALNSATAGIQSFGSTVMSAFGPIGAIVSGALSGLFDVLGKLPGAALAAFAAFKVFGLIAPIFATASTAVAAFSARMLAFQASSALGAAAATGVGVAAGRVSSALSKVGAALPLIGVALIAVGFAYDAVRSKADEAASAVISGSMSMASAVQMESEQLAEQSRLLPALFDAKGKFIGLTAQSVTAADFEAQAQDRVKASIEKHIQAMGPLEAAQARVKVSTQNLQDLQASGTATAAEIATAMAVLGRDQANLSTIQDRLAVATKGTTAAMKAQADQMAAQATSVLGYEAALRQVTAAQQAADEAIKRGGASSVEAQNAIGSLSTAQLDAAAKAKELAAANGALDGGTKAYLTTLAAMPRNTAAGAAGFTKLASTMSQAELDMISGAAAATGLRTELVAIPGGKSVRVVVEADQQKAIAKLQADLQNLKDKTVNVNGNAKPLADAVKTVTSQLASAGATINIDGNTVPVADALSTILTQIASGRPVVVIDGKAVPAEQALSTFLAKVGNSGGMVTINGETMPAAQALALLLQTADGSTATPKISADASLGTAALNAWKALADGTSGIAGLDANPFLADAVLRLWKSTSDTTTGLPKLDADSGMATGVLAAWQALANGTTGIPALDSNPALAAQVLAAWKAQSDATTGIPKLDADPGPANAKSAAWKAAADNMGATARLDADTSAAQSKIDSFISMNNGRTITIYTTTLGSGGEASAGRLAGGGVVGYSGGGVVPLRAAGGMVLPGYSPGRDTVPAMLSRGESVLNPELTRMLGASRILQANSEASGGRPTTSIGSIAGMMDGSIRGSGGPAAAAMSVRQGSGGGPSAAQTAAYSGMASMAAGMNQLRGDVQGLAAEIRKQRPFVVEDRSGNPVETARATALALAIA